MITISFTIYGLIFVIIAAITAASIVAFILDNWDVICLYDPWDMVCLFIAVFGIVVILTMGLFSKGNFDDYTETEYNIEQMIADAKNEGYQIEERFRDIEEPTLRIYTSLISNKKSYKLYIPTGKKQEMEKYRRTNEEID